MSFEEKKTSLAIRPALILLVTILPAIFLQRIENMGDKSPYESFTAASSENCEIRGFYAIMPLTDETMFLTADTERYVGNHPLSLTEDETVVTIFADLNQPYQIRFHDMGFVLATDTQGSPVAYYDDFKSLYYAPEEQADTKWYLVGDEEQGFKILNGEGKALCYDLMGKKVYLGDDGEDGKQRWRLRMVKREDGIW